MKKVSGFNPRIPGSTLFTNHLLCFAGKATYIIEHIDSKSKYIMFTTHNDYCDGGNTSGVAVDIEIYQKEADALKSLLAEISDHGVYCADKCDYLYQFHLNYFSGFKQ